MNKFLLLIVGLFVSVAANAQDEPQHEPIQALRQRLASAGSDIARLNLRLTIAAVYAQDDSTGSHNTDTALMILAAGEKAPALQNDHHLQGLYHYALAIVFRSQGKTDSARRHARLAIDNLQPLSLEWAKACVEYGYNYSHGDPTQDSVRTVYFKKAIPVFAAAGTPASKEWQAHTLMCLAQSDTYTADGSRPLYLKALDLYNSIGYRDLRNLYSHIGGTYASVGDQVRALDYCLLAARLDDARPHSDGLSDLIYSQIGYCYNNQGKYADAVPMFRRALELSIQEGDTNNMTSITNNLVQSSLSMGDYAGALKACRQSSAAYRPAALKAKVMEAKGYASVFEKMHQPDSMRPYVEQLIRLDAGLPSNAVLRLHCIMTPVKYFNMTGQYPQAKKYALEAMRLGHLLDLIQAVYFAYHELAVADSAMGNYKLAMDEYERYILAKDSMQDVNNKKQLVTLQLQYETEKKDKDIQSLHHKEQISEIALRQASVTRNFIIGGALLLLVLLAVSVNRYRLKQRSNRQLNRILSEKDLLLTEKEWLLKEIHHRVKNNLQIGISLLNLQSYHIENEKAQSAIRQSRNRMYAMSLIHQRLYQADNLKTIDMQQYIGQLIESIRDSYATEKDIEFALVVQRLEMDVEYALPIGLIINEAVTNSLKYAFPRQQKGRIAIGLENADGLMTLSIADNGVGLANGFDIHQHASMGTQLIDILVQQLDGHIDIAGESGLLITIQFPDPDKAAHPIRTNTNSRRPSPQYS
jgi:two-component sensor histidine kinase